MRKFKNIYFSKYFTAIAALLVSGGMPTSSWGMAGKTVEKLSGTVARRLTAQGALLRARIAANPTPQAPRPTTLGQLVTRRATQRNLTTQVPQNNYRDYRNYDNYGNSGRYGHARPFNYSVLGSLGAAAMGFTLANRKPAQALIEAEGPTMLSFTFKGWIKNVIFLPDIHFEGAKDYQIARTTIDYIKENQWEQMYYSMLRPLARSFTPTKLYLEHRLWAGRRPENTPYLLSKMINFAIDNNWRLGNLQIIAIDNRTEEELGEEDKLEQIPKIRQALATIPTQALNIEKLSEKSQLDAQAIIDKAKVPQKIKLGLEQEAAHDLKEAFKYYTKNLNSLNNRLLEIKKTTEQIKYLQDTNAPPSQIADLISHKKRDIKDISTDHKVVLVETHIAYNAIKMNTLLSCKIWEDLLSFGDKNIIVYAGSGHTRRVMRRLFQAQNKKMPDSVTVPSLEKQTIEHSEPIEKEKVVSKHIEKFTTQEDFGTAITDYIQNNKTYVPLENLIK